MMVASSSLTGFRCLRGQLKGGRRGLLIRPRMSSGCLSAGPVVVVVVVGGLCYLLLGCEDGRDEDRR